MVQLKYFGDSRDYFKYDLITFLMRNGVLKNYVFIPMLTEHRVDGEGNKLPKAVPGKSSDLLSYIDSCNSKDLDHWSEWLKPFVGSYKTIHPVNKVFFSNKSRKEYWSLFKELLVTECALVFIDPDTGLESGNPSYLRRMGPEKYIFNEELTYLFNRIDEQSVLMIYQHLPNNKNIHKESVEKKIQQAISSTDNAYVVAYREDDLAFIFIAKARDVYESLRVRLKEYFEMSEHKYKSIH